MFQLIFQLRGDSQGTACVHDVCISERSILIKVRPHTERVRVARPEEISRRIVQGQQRQSRLPAATKLSRSDMDVVRRCPCRSRRSGRQSRLLAAIKLVQGVVHRSNAGPLSSPRKKGNVWSRSGTLFLFRKSLDPAYPAYPDPGTSPEQIPGAEQRDWQIPAAQLEP